MSAARRVRFGGTKRPPFENTRSLFAAEAGIAETTLARVDKMGKVARFFFHQDKMSASEKSYKYRCL